MTDCPTIAQASSGRSGPYSKMRSGKKFYYLDPSPEDVDILDIAHALSHLCRFNGHTRDFFSVSQHSVEVSDLCLIMAPEGRGLEAALAGLLHDAPEYVLGDWATPLKNAVGEGFRKVEEPVAAAVFAGLDVADLMNDPELTAIWQKADRIMLYSDALRWGMDECQDVLGMEVPGPREWVPEDFTPRFANAVPLSSPVAYDLFLTTYYRLVEALHRAA